MEKQATSNRNSPASAPSSTSAKRVAPEPEILDQVDSLLRDLNEMRQLLQSNPKLDREKEIEVEDTMDTVLSAVERLAPMALSLLAAL